MGKYSNTLLDVFSIFGSPGWVAESITTVPQNFAGSTDSSKFIRVSVIASGGGINTDSVSGLILISIFTPNGKGPAEAAAIADKLDNFLVGVSISLSGAVTQITSGSSFDAGKEDENNSMFLHSTYQVQFNHFQSQ